MELVRTLRLSPVTTFSLSLLTDLYHSWLLTFFFLAEVLIVGSSNLLVSSSR